MGFTRRFFLKASLYMSLMIASYGVFLKKIFGNTASGSTSFIANITNQEGNNGLSSVYLAQDGSSEDNLENALDMMGGIQKYINKNDIVVIKPNAQRYNQGMTNTDSMRAFIDLVLGVDGFSGEIIIAENHQHHEDNCCGWSTTQSNGKFNLNELVEHYNSRGHENVTKYHWHVAGKCSYPLEGDAQGDSRVRGPEDGDGYVWMEDNYYLAPSGRKCLMTYPVFTSSYSGVTVDLKNGAWKDGKYLEDRTVKFINFSCLNHHGPYAGVTASVKNLMGVVDMTCGFPGDSYSETYNTHHIGVSRKKHWLYHGHWRLREYKGKIKYRIKNLMYRDFHHTGGALGHFMRTVRRPDLNIIAAHMVGWGDRLDTTKAFYPKALLASTDPVALDYVAAKEVLLPGTPKGEYERSGISLRELNDPDDKDGPFYKFLLEANRQGIGSLDPDKIKVYRKTV